LAAITADLGKGAFSKALVEGIVLRKAELLGEGFIATSTHDSYAVHRVEQSTNDQHTPSWTVRLTSRILPLPRCGNDAAPTTAMGRCCRKRA
jgi:hypothetical protein